MAKMSAKTRNLRRIRQQIRRMEKRGYVFDDEFKNSLKDRSARSLAQIKTEGLYKRSKIKVPDLETGEVKVVAGTKGRAFERSQAARKSAETRRRQREYEEIPDISDEVIENLDALLFKLGQPVSQMAEADDGHLFPKSSALRNYSNGAKNTLQRMLQEEIQKLNAEGEDGKKLIAQRIYEMSDVIEEVLGVIEYSAYAGAIQTAVITFANVIRSTARPMSNDSVLELSDFLEEEFEGWTEG